MVTQKGEKSWRLAIGLSYVTFFFLFNGITINAIKYPGFLYFFYSILSFYIILSPAIEELIKLLAFRQVKWNYFSISILCFTFIAFESAFKIQFSLQKQSDLALYFLDYFSTFSPAFLHIFLAVFSIQLRYKKGFSSLQIFGALTAVHYAYNILRSISNDWINCYSLFDTFVLIIFAITIASRMRRSLQFTH
jgi:hypothetical protein